jgi:hypothetical protein
MKNRHLLIIALAFAAISLPGQGKAQHNFNIPFSQYGIGLSDMPNNMPTAFGMGGTVYARAARNSINPFNPASYAAVETESFVFDIGLNIQTSVLRKDVNRLTDADGNLAYITVAFPVTQWWKTSAGLLPYSKSNYESVQTKSDPAGLGNVKTIYAGHGGVSQIYWGNAFNIGQRLSLGFNLNYLYGNITRAITYNFQGNDSTYCINSRRQKNTYVSNLLIDLGLQYLQPLGADYTLHIGATARTPRNMKVNDHALSYTYLTYASTEYLFDTIFPQPGESDTYKSQLLQPLAVGLGLGLERNEKWEIDIDGYYSPYSGLQYKEDPAYNLFGTSALRLTPNWRVALGAEWKGDPAAGSYWGRIGVSAGLYHNHGRLALAPVAGNPDQPTIINETGCGLGFRLPMRKGRSVLTLALGYSSIGTAQLLRRDVFTVGLSIGSCERWFVKRKYN